MEPTGTMAASVNARLDKAGGKIMCGRSINGAQICRGELGYVAAPVNVVIPDSFAKAKDTIDGLAVWAMSKHALRDHLDRPRRTAYGYNPRQLSPSPSAWNPKPQVIGERDAVSPRTHILDASELPILVRCPECQRADLVTLNRVNLEVLMADRRSKTAS